MRLRTILSTAALSLLLSTSVPAIPGPSSIPIPVVRSSAPSKGIKVLNEKNPGQVVDIFSNLVEGQTNVVVFFADW